MTTSSGTIIRTYHNKEKPYVMLCKKSLWDERLSLEAVGLWSRLISRPDDWQIHITELAKSCRKNRDTINKYMNELCEFGYAVRWQERQQNSDGTFSSRFGAGHYLIFEEPKSAEEIKEILTERKFSVSEIYPLLSTDSYQEPKETFVCSSVPEREEILPPKEETTAVFRDYQGRKITVTREQIFSECVLKRKCWTSQEIIDAFIILKNYKAPVRDYFRFIEGTIGKHRNFAKAEAWKKKKQKDAESAKKNLFPPPPTSNPEECKLPEKSSSAPVEVDIKRQLFPDAYFL